MRLSWQTGLVLIMLSGAAISQESSQLTEFAPGVVSGKQVFGVSFTRDGNTAYFCETDANISFIKIRETHRIGGTWSEPRPVPFSPDGPQRDIDPFITPDGKHMIFESNRAFAGRDASRTDFDVYIMDRSSDGWGEPRPIREANSEGNEVFVSTNARGDLYFSSDRAGGKGKADFYTSRATKSGYAPPVAITELNTEDNDSNLLVAADDSYVIFSRGGDLYVSHHKGSGWGAPEKLPLVNTPDFNEYAPAFSADGCCLYFSRVRFENGKRASSGTIYSVPLTAVGLKRRRAAVPMPQ
jgi:hypothetical protein